MPSKPIARLTPLGWTGIGFPWDDQLWEQTNFNLTYFTRNDQRIGDVDLILWKFWESENVALAQCEWLKKDHQAVNMVKRSLKNENKKYQEEIPWKKEESEVPNNLWNGFWRLQNTEKHLKKNQELAAVNTDMINQYVEKRYMRKVPEATKVPLKLGIHFTFLSFGQIDQQLKCV